MLSYSNFIIDQELLLAEDEYILEGILGKVLDKMKDFRGSVEQDINKAKTTKNPKELGRLGSHSHFGVRLQVARRKETPLEVLKKFVNDTSEYKSVQHHANNTLKALGLG